MLKSKIVVFKLLLLSFILLVVFNSYANTPYYNYKILTIQNGLLSNTNKVVYQDKQGFVWFGSVSGLTRYDGNSFINYEYEPHKSNCLSNSNIDAIVEDENGNLFVGTNNGLNKFNLSTKQISYLTVYRQSKAFVVKVNSLLIDAKHNLWMGSNHGIFIYNLNSKQFIDSLPVMANADEVNTLCIDRQNNIWFLQKGNVYRYSASKTNEVSLDKIAINNAKFNEVFCIKDVGSGVWISTNSGNYLFDYASQKLVAVNIVPEQAGAYIGNITDVYLDKYNTLWVGSVNGLYYMNNAALNAPLGHVALSVMLTSFKTFFTVNKIYPDSKGNIWVNSPKEGIMLLYPSNVKSFKFHQYIEQQANSLGSNYITSVAVNEAMQLFVGTDGGGLNGFSSTLGKYQRYYNSANFKGLNVSVMSTYVDANKSLWFGTYNKSLYQYSSSKGLINYSHLLEPYNKPNNYAINVITGYKNKILVGTNGYGLFAIDTIDFTVQNYTVESCGLSNNYITCLYVDSSNNVWVGTYWGLNRLNLEANKNQSFLYNKNKANSISNNTITCVNQDFTGNLWVCTHYGLNALQAADTTFKTITKASGLPSSVISAVQPDNNNTLWISTQRGLCSMDLLTRNVVYFELNNKNDIIEFTANASARADNGMLYFGSNKGLLQFHPDSMLNISKTNKVVFTDIKLLNQSVYGSNQLNLSQASNANLELTIHYHQKALSIDYASLNFVDSYRDEYMIMLEGFDTDWQHVGTLRIATYTNLKAGEYIFRVKQVNQKLDQAAVLKIKVEPPFWKTWYAFLFYGVLVTLLLRLYTKYSIIKVNVKNELLIQKIQRLKDQEVNDMKMRFFTNISHEFCTPLTLIIAPLEKLKAENDANKLYDLILKNAHRLLRLINQLMEFRMIESDTLKLDKQNHNVVTFCREIFNAFNDLAAKNAIEYTFNTDIESLIVAFDIDKLEKILYNLLSNAFKYTPNCGAISVHVLQTQQTIEISISDSGIGISHDKIPFIFDRFYNEKTKNNLHDLPEYSSFGVGLSLTKRLVELHQGSIEVSSQVNEGTTFVLKLPIALVAPSKAAQTGQLNVDAIGAKVKTYLNYDFYRHTANKTLDAKQESSVQKQSILLVEDNDDIRAFLNDLLAVKYTVHEALNGQEGLLLADKEDVDLIITDVIMPLMGGVEFCKKIKKDIKTSHIPILIVSALHAQEHVIEGLKSGANDFITKPFDPLVLNTKIENILNTQANLHQKFKQNIVVKPNEVATNTKDEVFIKEAMAIIETNLTNENVSVEMLAEKLNLSPISLYRKLKKMTGLSTNEFIRSIRLKKAANYLNADAALTINEVSFMVGFNDVQYFRQCFKKEFGLNPNEYKKQNG